MRKRNYLLVAGRVPGDVYKKIQKDLYNDHMSSSIYRLGIEEWNVQGLDDIRHAVRTLQLPSMDPGPQALRYAYMPLAPMSKLLCPLQELVPCDTELNSFREVVIRSAVNYWLESDTTQVVGLVISSDAYSIAAGSPYSIWTRHLPDTMPIWRVHDKNVTPIPRG